MILALIPARGGSKGIPRKNIGAIAGKPLIVWTIDAALGVAAIDRVVVTTDDAEIAEVARAAGADVPFLRPVALARDETPGIDPALHALGVVPGYQTLVLLQPTSPLRTPGDITAALDLFTESKAPSVVSVSEARDHPFHCYARDSVGRLSALLPGGGETRRQDLPAALALNGAIYVVDTKWLTAGRRFIGPETIGYVMPPERSIDIDTRLDWELAEVLLTKRAAA